jgi:hypothetical protein
MSGSLFSSPGLFAVAFSGAASAFGFEADWANMWSAVVANRISVRIARKVPYRDGSMSFLLVITVAQGQRTAFENRQNTNGGKSNSNPE